MTGPATGEPGSGAVASAWPLPLSICGVWAGSILATTTDSVGSGSTAVPASAESAGGVSAADSLSASSPMQPVSNAAKPGGVQARAAACICALNPTGVSPVAKAVSIASAITGFLLFALADAQAAPKTVRAMSRMRASAKPQLVGEICGSGGLLGQRDGKQVRFTRSPAGSVAGDWVTGLDKPGEPGVRNGTLGVAKSGRMRWPPKKWRGEAPPAWRK